MTRMKDRRWLGHISYRQGKFEFKSQRRVISSDESASHVPKAYFEDALKLVESLSKHSRSHMVNQEGFMSDEAKRLRWFVLPSEALKELQSSDYSVSASSPFHVRQYQQQLDEGARSEECVR